MFHRNLVDISYEDFEGFFQVIWVWLPSWSCDLYHSIFWLDKSAETQSGLPLLPWSCYASVIQCDIIQYLLFLFYYNTGIISFLAIYNDTILCTIFCVSERLYAKKNHCF